MNWHRDRPEAWGRMDGLDPAAIASVRVTGGGTRAPTLPVLSLSRAPHEVHFGRDARAETVPLCGALTAKHLDGDRELPVLRLRDAA